MALQMRETHPEPVLLSRRGRSRSAVLTTVSFPQVREPAQDHREEEHAAVHDLQPARVDLVHRQEVLEQIDAGSSQHCSEEPTATAIKRGSAERNGCDPKQRVGRGKAGVDGAD